VFSRLSRKWIAIGLAAFVLCLLGGGGAYAYHRWERQQALKPAPLPKNAVVIQAPSPVPAADSPTPTPNPSPAAPTPPPTAPTGVQVLSAPYTGQAPSGNWDSFHEETCEAAAVLTVGYWYANKYVGSEVQTIPPAEADQKLHQIVAWERAQFKGVDLPLTSVAQVGANFYNLDSQVLPIPADNPEAIRQQIAARHPVIIPVMTQLLNGQKINNAYTYHRGPGGYGVYHLLVLIGYNSSTDQFYADDPGIVPEGKRALYSWSTLSSAIDAQTVSPNTAVRQGRVMLVFTPRG
jgi:hypothetical protein